MPKRQSCGCAVRFPFLVVVLRILLQCLKETGYTRGDLLPAVNELAVCQLFRAAWFVLQLEA